MADLGTVDRVTPDLLTPDLLTPDRVTAYRAMGSWHGLLHRRLRHWGDGHPPKGLWMSGRTPMCTAPMTQSRQAADAQGGLCADSASQPVLCPDDKQILRFLSDCIKLASISGQESAFVRLIENWAAGEGLSTECFETDEAALATYPQLSQRHIPLRGRPTLIVGVSKGASGGRRLLFNAHSDVVGAGDESAWRYPPFGGQIVGDRVYGRGASDAKGPLVAALWAMATVAQQRAEKSGPASDGGDVLLELVPGRGGAELEAWSLKKEAAYFREVFRRELAVEVA